MAFQHFIFRGLNFPDKYYPYQAVPARQFYLVNNGYITITAS